MAVTIEEREPRTTKHEVVKLRAWLKPKVRRRFAPRNLALPNLLHKPVLRRIKRGDTARRGLCSSVRVEDTAPTASPPASPLPLPAACIRFVALSALFRMLCALLLLAPFYLSGFWPSSYDYSAQAMLVSLTACACLLMALRPKTNTGAYHRAHIFRPLSGCCWRFAWCAVSSLFTVYWHDTLLEMARVGVCFSLVLHHANTAARKTVATEYGRTERSRSIAARRTYDAAHGYRGRGGWVRQWYRCKHW